MRLSAPRNVTWWVALVAGGVGLLERYGVVHLPLIGPFSTALIVFGWALLILATLLRGL